jgi:hypothetical protein
LDDPSGEPGQDFFADAVTDDPIKEPSRLDDEEAVERGELASRVEQTPTSAERPAALNMPAAAGDADNPAEVGTAALELEFWNAIKDSSDAAAYEAYLETYPQGSFARLARLRAEQLATPATVAPPSDKPSADRQVASSPPADEPTPTAPAAAAPPPDKPSADRQVASSPSADEPARAAPDDGRLLSDWRLRVDIVKRAIAQSRAALRESRAVFGEFEIVDAAPVESNNRLVELKTVYTIKMNVTTAAGYRDKGIDNKIIYHQTVVVDRRNVTVVEVGDVVVGDDGSKFAKPQLNSVDDGPLLARQPDPPAWTQLGGG